MPPRRRGREDKRDDEFDDLEDDGFDDLEDFDEFEDTRASTFEPDSPEAEEIPVASAYEAAAVPYPASAPLGYEGPAPAKPEAPATAMSAVVENPSASSRRSAAIQGGKERAAKERTRPTNERIRARRRSRDRNAAAVSAELGTIARRAERREYRTYALLGMLAAIAGGALAAGAWVDNTIFWAVAASIFFLAMAALVAYAATGLGVFAEMVELARLRVEQPSPATDSAPTTSVDTVS